MALELFPRDRKDGVFRGFQQGGLEFHADLALPYRAELQNVPMHGQFLLVQLEHPNEAVLGRIASFSSEGKLSFGSGEEFNIRAMLEERQVPDDLREQYLRYRVNIRVLGAVRVVNDKLTYVPSHRRLPHVGAKVTFPTPEILMELAGHNLEGAPIGHLAFGEFVYYGKAQGVDIQDWMQVQSPEVQVRFKVEDLVSRRSFVFARAGYGKSNLNKLLFSELYRGDPTVQKRARRAPVGTLIFDPDGEYFWPDDKGRPGLADVPHLIDKLVVFTPRLPPSPYYGSFVVGGIKLDIRQLRAADVIGIALDSERQSQQNVIKLKGMGGLNWERLVNLVAKDKNAADEHEIADLMNLDLDRQGAEVVAARSNMTAIVNMLHDPASRMMDLLIRALSEGKICVVDLSQMRGRAGSILSSIILKRIFDTNQERFTDPRGATIPVIAVVEEAQSVLDSRQPASETYVSWVKEGRKYDLGALLITQQPGSIPIELLSQGDNWFIFHLLSSADLGAAQRANAHFSEDLLSSLLNEPIPGQGLMWSGVSGKAYPVPFRVASFEKIYPMADPNNNRTAKETYASRLRGAHQSLLASMGLEERPPSPSTGAAPGSVVQGATGAGEADSEPTLESPVDVLEALRQHAISALRNDKELMQRFDKSEGVPWGAIQSFLENQFPTDAVDANRQAYLSVPIAMNAIFGTQGQAWEKYAHPRSQKAWLRKK